MTQNMGDLLHERRHMRKGILVKSCPTCWLLYVSKMDVSKMGIKQTLEEDYDE